MRHIEDKFYSTNISRLTIILYIFMSFIQDLYQDVYDTPKKKNKFKCNELKRILNKIYEDFCIFEK